MNYLVTGAAGFIGAAIAERLLSCGHSLTTIDNLSTGCVEHIPEGVNFIFGDASDKVTIEKLNNEKYDAIIHIAGQSSGEVSFDDPVYDLRTNTESTLLLLDYAKKNKIKKFIYASSMSAYGDHQPPVCCEETATVPKSFYAVGKLASENYMRIYSKFGIACTALRFFNVYGVGQNLKNLRQGMASIFLAMAIKDHHIQVKGSKDRFRDFVYIDDVVNAVLASLNRTEGYSVYNVCTNKPTTVEQVVSAIQSHLPYDVIVEYTSGTPGDQFGIYGDHKKITQELDWIPRIDFCTGMEIMTKWAVDTFDIWGK